MQGLFKERSGFSLMLGMPIYGPWACHICISLGSYTVIGSFDIVEIDYNCLARC